MLYFGCRHDPVRLTEHLRGTRESEKKKQFRDADDGHATFRPPPPPPSMHLHRHNCPGLNAAWLCCLCLFTVRVSNALVRAAGGGVSATSRIEFGGSNSLVVHEDHVPVIRGWGWYFRDADANLPTCPNPHATSAMGYGVRGPFPPGCSMHRSLSSAAIVHTCMTVLRQPTHFLCNFASPHHCLETPGDFPSCLLRHPDGNVYRRERKCWVQSLRTLRHWSIRQLTKIAAHLLKEKWSIVEDPFRAAAATVHHLKKRSQPFTSYLGMFQPKKGPHAPHPPNLLRVRVAVTVLDTWSFHLSVV